MAAIGAQNKISSRLVKKAINQPGRATEARIVLFFMGSKFLQIVGGHVITVAPVWPLLNATKSRGRRSS
jgi:hypothetical protein